MKISTRLLIANGILLIIAFAVIVAIANHNMRRQALYGTESKIKIMADQYVAVHTYFSKNLKPALFKLTEPAHPEEYINPEWISSTHAMLDMVKDIRKHENGEYHVKVAAINARNPENEATSFEKKFILELMSSSKLQNRSSTQVLDGKTYFVYLRRGEVMEDSCLRCHSIPEHGFDRNKGAPVSAISIRVPLSDIYGYANYSSLKLSIFLLVILITIFSVISWLNRCFIYKPLSAIHNKALAISNFNEKLAEGIPYKALEIPGFDEKFGKEIPLISGREFKELAIVFNKVLITLGYHIDNMVNLIKQRNLELSETTEQLYNDVNERKQKDEALRKANEFLDTLIKSSPLAIFSLDLKGTVLSWNEAAEKIFGWEKSDVIGHIVSKLHDTDEYSKRALQGEVFTNIEIGVLKKDGMPIDISFSTAPLRDAKGRITGAIAIVDDISERKKMQLELFKAQKLESLGVLAGGIAHDFNNVLTSVSGNIQLAKMRLQSETKTYDLLNSAERALVKAQKLSIRLLTFAKGGAPQKKIISIPKLIKYSCTIAQLGSKSVCEFSVPEDLWQVEADSGQISLVFSNIVTNASQAMPKGDIVRIAARNFIMDDRQSLPMKPGRYVHISIRDQGPGIPEEYLSKIFDPYFTTKNQNSGLGLAAAYSIINKHNGHIFAKSRPGVGTTFHIYLPAYGNVIPIKEEANPLTERGNILVMDDDIMIKTMMKEMLDALGYESEFAKDGDEAIEMYKKAIKSGKPYDAVILDLTIPGGMGGKEAVKKLLEIDNKLKAIVCSGYSDDPIMSDHRKYGFKGMLPKPFNFKSLGKMLNDVVKS